MLLTNTGQAGTTTGRGISTRKSSSGSDTSSCVPFHVPVLIPLAHSSEMGCSSGRLPCQPAVPMQLPTLDPDCSLPQEAMSASATPLPKTPDHLSTLERLAQATGGTEKSWYRCVFPFGVISLVIGMAGTGVTFTFNTMPETKVVSLVLLAVGFVMLLVAAACWRVHQARRRKRKESAFFCAEQGAL
ncbi:transmembrane protein 100-like [Brachyhypopomus gauderio]|uniref:transmembrane protein 100-like n=1 Tax=Brachyhypopomus gauderio TaxID=698409 RepID=UPI004041A85F